MQTIALNGKTILVTGSPGFIGANLVLRLLKELSAGAVVSLDNMNDYYEVSLKEWRLQQIEKAAEASPVRVARTVKAAEALTVRVATAGITVVATENVPESR